jgi:hypothetical protein
MDGDITYAPNIYPKIEGVKLTLREEEGFPKDG